MNNKKLQKLKLLKRKKIWPCVIGFLLFLIMCVTMLGMFMVFFTQYVLASKIEAMSDQTQRTADVLNNSLQWGRSLTQAAEEADAYNGEDSAVYIIDRDGRVLVNTGDSEPDFSKALEISLGDNYIFIGDSEWEEGDYTLFGIPMNELFDGALDYDTDAEGDEWLHQPVVNQRFWLWRSLRYHENEYMMFVRCNLSIERQDAFYLITFGLLMLFILMMPMSFFMISVIRSIYTQRKMMQLIYLDDVTEQKNWLYFKNTAARILAMQRMRRRTYVLVCLHMERYKNFCACYGVKDGEALLAETAGFLQARIGKGEIAARNEGADFGLFLCIRGENEEECRRICEKRLRSLLAELVGIRPDQRVHFHAGAYLIAQEQLEGLRRGRKNWGELDIDQMYNYANAAQMSTKCQEEHRVAFFDKELLDKQLWERRVEDTMDLALKNEEFKVYLQPKYSPTEARLVGAEALVRWISPEEGFVSPGRFIPLFEENGFITQLDDYMISHVAKLQAEWKIRGRKMVPISVNVSRAHFAQEGLAEHICQLVDAYGPPHELIELEVTESAFFDDKEILVETVKQLKAYGFRVSMDDFGAGYSSLNSLKDIPLDVLKLDSEFFRGKDEDGRGEIVVKEAIQLARSLNMRVVAEGIEKKEQVDFLAGQGCDMIQGFYFAKPMPVAEFEDKVEKDA